MFYFVKTPWWLKIFYSNCIWQISTREKVMYLTFDDGPHEYATPFVLDTLNLYNARATFFCIGKNVAEQPALYERIISEGHAVGNHTFNHLNGWKTANDIYISDIIEAGKYIDSTLFRPPYGKAKRSQLKILGMGGNPLTSVMWTVLSGDFEATLAPEKCLRNVLRKSGKGSIVVFHDSEKAYQRMAFALPKVLEYFTGKGYRFEKISV